MKRIHFISLVILLSSVFTFTSCLDSDNESNYDLRAFMTYDSGFMGSGVLKPDGSNFIFTPTNPGLLKLFDKDGKPTGEYMKRGYVYVKFIEGEVFPQDDKNDYKVEIVGASILLSVKEMSMHKPEIVEDSNPLYQLENSDYRSWVSNGYFNILFYPTYDKVENLKIEDFDLFIDKVENNTLYLRLNHSITKVEEPAYSPQVFHFMSFKHYLSKSHLLSEYPDLKPDDKNVIKVKILAKGVYGDLESSTFEMLLTD